MSRNEKASRSIDQLNVVQRVSPECASENWHELSVLGEALYFGFA
jgi:hypothetical protein